MCLSAKVGFEGRAERIAPLQKGAPIGRMEVKAARAGVQALYSGLGQIVSRNRGVAKRTTLLAQAHSFTKHCTLHLLYFFLTTQPTTTGQRTVHWAPMIV